MTRYTLDPREGRLHGDGAPIELTPKACALLHLLVERRGLLVTKAEILARVWPDTAVTEGSIKDYVKHLRRALDDVAAVPRHIETLRGRGYRYIGDVELALAATPGPTSGPVVAVLPFEVEVAPAKETEHLGRGLCEDILFGLSAYRQLVVISQFSSFRLGEVDPVTAARQLGADYLVVGTIRPVDRRVRLAVQLLDGERGQQLWADRFDAPPGAIGDEVVQAIVCRLVGQVERARTDEAVARGRAGELSAYERVLVGRFRLAAGHQADVLAARAIFAATTEEFPAFAPGFRWLAESYYDEACSPWSPDPHAAALDAFAAGRRALELDDRDSGAHLVVAWGYFRTQRSLELAAAELERALALNPNDYYTLCLASALSLWSGDLDAAVAHGEEALRRSPLAPDACSRTTGLAHYCAGRFGQALEALSRIRAPGVDVHAAVAACYARQGSLDQAAAAAAMFRAAIAAAGAAATSTLEDPARWRSYWTRTLPFRDPAHLDRLLEDLAVAGVRAPPTPS